MSWVDLESPCRLEAMEPVAIHSIPNHRLGALTFRSVQPSFIGGSLAQSSHYAWRAYHGRLTVSF